MGGARGAHVGPSRDKGAPAWQVMAVAVWAVAVWDVPLGLPLKNEAVAAGHHACPTPCPTGRTTARRAMGLSCYVVT